MKISGLSWIFSRLRRNGNGAVPETEMETSPKLQAYLNFLRDYGAGATYGSNLIGVDAPVEEFKLAA